MKLHTFECHFCLRRIVGAPVARQWWHRETGSIHCFPDLFMEDGSLRYFHKATPRWDTSLRAPRFEEMR
jgi:hypothetical protein